MPHPDPDLDPSFVSSSRRWMKIVIWVALVLVAAPFLLGGALVAASAAQRPNRPARSSVRALDAAKLAVELRGRPLLTQKGGEWLEVSGFARRVDEAVIPLSASYVYLGAGDGS